MTLLEKIKATTWYNSILKHREILLDLVGLNTALELRVEDLESGGSGATPSLQQVTTTGAETTLPIKVAELQLYDVANSNYAKIVNDEQIFYFKSISVNLTKFSIGFWLWRLFSINQILTI